MSTPSVAVIICTYNMAKYLPESLDSVLSLVYPNLKIIVVDDGSEDETQELIKKRYSEKITYVYQKNRGLFAARKAGIAAAGNDVKYYSIVDADDIVHPLKVHDEVAFLQRFTDVAICFSNLFFVDKKSGVIVSYWDGSSLIGANKLYGEIENPVEKIANFRAFTSVSTIRASAYHQVGGYDGTLKCSGDLDLAIRLTRVGGVGFINKLRYLYRHDSQGMTQYMPNRVVVYMRIFDKVKTIASGFTSEEMVHLGRLEKKLLMQALWGSYLGSTDKKLRKEIQNRLLEDINAKERTEYCIIKFIGLLRLAKTVSKLRSRITARRNRSKNKLSLQKVLEDMSLCFDSI